MPATNRLWEHFGSILFALKFLLGLVLRLLSCLLSWSVAADLSFTLAAGALLNLGQVLRKEDGTFKKN